MSQYHSPGFDACLVLVVRLQRSHHIAHALDGGLLCRGEGDNGQGNVDPVVLHQSIPGHATAVGNRLVLVAAHHQQVVVVLLLLRGVIGIREE